MYEEGEEKKDKEKRKQYVRKREIAKESEEEEATEKTPWVENSVSGNVVGTRREKRWWMKRMKRRSGER